MTQIEFTDNALVIDGSGSSVFVGILDRSDQWTAKVAIEGAPLEQLFIAVERVLQEASTELSSIGHYIYSEGPGSVLGLRLCAMAMETWSRLHTQPASFHAYNSLHLTAAALLKASPELTEALLVSDWKKGAWNAVYIRAGAIQPIEVVDQATLESWTGPRYHLPQRKGWQSPPENAIPLSYDPTQIAQLRQQAGLLKETSGVALYSSGINTFQKWQPQRHRAADAHA